jgi:hypothetical protein
MTNYETLVDGTILKDGMFIEDGVNAYYVLSVSPEDEDTDIILELIGKWNPFSGFLYSIPQENTSASRKKIRHSFRLLSSHNVKQIPSYLEGEIDSLRKMQKDAEEQVSRVHDDTEEEVIDNEKTIENISSREEIVSYICTFPVGAWLIGVGNAPKPPKPPAFFTNEDKKKFVELIESIQSDFTEILEDTKVRDLLEDFLVAVVPKIVVPKTMVDNDVNIDDETQTVFLLGVLEYAIYVDEITSCLHGESCYSGQLFSDILPTNLNAPYSRIDRKRLLEKKTHSDKRIETSPDRKSEEFTTEQSELNAPNSQPLTKKEVSDIQALALLFNIYMAKESVTYRKLLSAIDEINNIFSSDIYMDTKYALNLNEESCKLYTYIYGTPNSKYFNRYLRNALTPKYPKYNNDTEQITLTKSSPVLPKTTSSISDNLDFLKCFGHKGVCQNKPEKLHFYSCQCIRPYCKECSSDDLAYISGLLDFNPEDEELLCRTHHVPSFIKEIRSI